MVPDEGSLGVRFASFNGDRFGDINIDRGDVSFTGAEELALWLRGLGDGRRFGVVSLRNSAAIRQSVFVARFDQRWWVFQVAGTVYTPAEPPLGPAIEWPHVEIPEPFWGSWNVLPFWAAVSSEDVAAISWEIVATEDGSHRLPYVKVPLDDFAIAPRHQRAFEEGAAIMSDWDEIEQRIPPTG